ncbi:CobW family GTP-binding protein [Paenibacillus whitsoniae]|uniref:GTP-binding protein n=1 Tax=Paenibacillus whitsoniae TaxID=2496558 RepID=A0A3S0A6W8_9BACL|nr:GTP-binding protein [Paenibacillus whitsoniae]RTE11030.1 GTP-binding protein [Paenibacillus whitsoniae]
MNKTIPIYLLSGFLGSGKTSLLNILLDYCRESGLKPAVIMNEIGDINIDGQVIDIEIPMAEMLSGCICCTISGDLGATILDLCRTYSPDVIIIESTGVANPMEVIDSITESSLLTEVELKTIVTVVDVRYLLELNAAGTRRTLRLMEDQIRCAGWLILNKVDQVTPDELRQAEQLVRRLNAYAAIKATVHCIGSLDFMTVELTEDTSYLRKERQAEQVIFDKEKEEHAHGSGCDHHHHSHDDHHTHSHDHHGVQHHHSYDHVMVYTHYFQAPIDRDEFEHFISLLPKEVYRAKGILTFANEDQPHLFQYAYRELEILKLRPRAEISNVAVFIGENFSKEEVIAAIQEKLLV